MTGLSPLKNHTIVFDLDGTLVDTAPDLLGALNHTLGAFGFDTVPPEAAYVMTGRGAKAMLHAGLWYQGASAGDTMIDDMFELFLSHYQANIAVHSQPYPGCIAALDRLLEAGATLAVCTNKRQQLADTLLKALNMSGHFSAIVGADSVENCKPAAEHLTETIYRAGQSLESSVMIGDSTTDEKAAANAGLPFIFVPFGYGPIATAPAGTRANLDHYSDLSVELIMALTAN